MPEGYVFDGADFTHLHFVNVEYADTGKSVAGRQSRIKVKVPEAWTRFNQQFSNEYFMSWDAIATSLTEMIKGTYTYDDYGGYRGW